MPYEEYNKPLKMQRSPGRKYLRFDKAGHAYLCGGAAGAIGFTETQKGYRVMFDRAASRIAIVCDKAGPYKGSGPLARFKVGAIRQLLGELDIDARITAKTSIDVAIGGGRQAACSRSATQPSPAEQQPGRLLR